MNTARTLPGHPYCIPAGECEDGFNPALWNDLGDSVKHAMRSGIPICRQSMKRSNPSGPVAAANVVYQNAFPVNAFLTSFGLGSGGLGATLSKNNSGELQAGFTRFYLRTKVHIPFVSKLVTMGGIPVTIINLPFFSIKFILTNVHTGVSGTIAHLFNNETSYTTMAPSYGVSAHGTSLLYCHSVGNAPTNFAVVNDIPTGLLPTLNQAEPCSVTVRIQSGTQIFWNGGNTADNPVGVESFSLVQLLECP